MSRGSSATWWARGVAAVLCLGLSLSTARAAPVLTYNQATGSNASNSNQSVGWQFDVLQAITVTGLGWFDQFGDGLVTSHTVGIWAPDGTLLTSVLVPSGTAAGLDGQFRTVAVAPVVLTVGAGYIVGGENFSNNTERLAANVSQTVDPRITFVDATFSNLGAGFTRPTSFSSATSGFYGPSFSIDSVSQIAPEPTTMALAAIGGIGLMISRRRRLF